MKNRYIFMSKCPALSGKAREFGRKYRRLAIVEVAADFPGDPAMISPRAKGVVRIVRDEVHSVGDTPRSLGFRVREEMKREVETLNR